MAVEFARKDALLPHQFFVPLDAITARHGLSALDLNGGFGLDSAEALAGADLELLCVV